VGVVRVGSTVIAITAGFRRWVIPRLPLILVGVLPTLLLSVGIARYVLNHFYARAPYLLDAGMLSKIVYRDGVFLPLPRIAVDYATSFYDVHFSPLLSLFSVVSYLVPVGRIVWFAIVQGILYAPIGLAVYAVAARLDPSSALRRLPITVLAALAFSFCGMVMWTVDYPHFEIATPGLTCLMLAAVVTDRRRMAWVCFALAAAVKQDAGIHIAMALLPLWFLRGRGVEMPPTRRKLAIMIAVAIGVTVGGIVCQKLFFHPVSRLQQAYIGHPMYAHLSWALLAARLSHFIATGQVIYFPFLATCLIALVRRDGRYLLGWASVVPWFVFNLLAVEETKAAFVAYGIAPFLVAVFWVYLYGAHLAPASRRLRAGVLESILVVVCATSTFGDNALTAFAPTLRSMAFTQYRDRAPVDDFVESLHAHRADFGRIRIDYAVAALAIESFDLTDRWSPGVQADTIAFHRFSAEWAGIMPDILLNRLDVCVRVFGTQLIVCSRDKLPARALNGLLLEEFPSLLVFSRLPRPDLPASFRATRDLITVTAGADLESRIGRIPAGHYQWTLHVLPAGEASFEVGQSGVILGSGSVGKGGTTITVPFSTNGNEDPVGYRIVAGTDTDVTVTHAELVRVAEPAPAPAGR